jgi:hypothetical protein
MLGEVTPDGRLIESKRPCGEDVRKALATLSAELAPSSAATPCCGVKSLLSYDHKLGYLQFNAGAVINDLYCRSLCVTRLAYIARRSPKDVYAALPLCRLESNLVVTADDELWLSKAPPNGVAESDGNWILSQETDAAAAEFPTAPLKLLSGNSHAVGPWRKSGIGIARAHMFSDVLITVNSHARTCPRTFRSP